MQNLKFQQRLEANFALSKRHYFENLKTLLVGAKLTKSFEYRCKPKDGRNNMTLKIGQVLTERFFMESVLNNMENPDSLFNIRIQSESRQLKIDKLYEEYQNLYHEYANLCEDVCQLDDDIPLDVSNIVYDLLRHKAESNSKIKKLEKKLSRIEQVFDDTI